MKLVIAEKPSVAMSLAAVLGATERKDGYLEGSGYLVSWCVGHLLELAQPEAYKEQYAKWRYEDLPILPENWKYEVPKDKKTQLALLCRLMKDSISDSRCTKSASVGDITRPTFSVTPYRTEKSRVALIPISQSAPARHTAAS